MSGISRREALALVGAALAPVPAKAARPKGYLVENSMHMFSADLKRFPGHPNGPYQPRPNSLENYIAFVREAKLDHTVLVHPEPYQDDHRYIEYCFTQEPSPGYFKGTCLFDPVDPKTPARIEELVQGYPNRFVAMRIHEIRGRNEPYTKTGTIRDRDLGAPEMKNTWRKIQQLGMAVEFQLLPYFAKPVGELASGFPDTPVLIDHLGWHTRGTPEEYEDVLRLSKLPQVYMKVTILGPESKAVLRRVYDAYGPDRIIWGGYDTTMAAFEKMLATIDDVLDYAPESDRVKIRGVNAMKVFKFPMNKA
ncbi:MAG TPA: amidohydrolase family protein [Bryobacteraceae bacterium]|nr:amidohydrolase family protein [Bryobacteraceae bacterium]